MDLPLQYDTIMNTLNCLLILIEKQTSSITPILSHKLYPKTYMHTLVMYVCMYIIFITLYCERKSIGTTLSAPSSSSFPLMVAKSKPESL